MFGFVEAGRLNAIGFKNAEHADYAGPGRWNDPDYILIGSVGDAFNVNAPPKPTSLTPDEQYTYMSMWSLMAAPLIYSGDMNHLDEFTLSLLCNPDVIDVDQDTLGTQARIVRRTADEFVLAKPLEDGSLAGRRQSSRSRARPVVAEAIKATA